jgi:hypothetical protein
MSVELTQVRPSDRPERAIHCAALSALVPGLGQLAQHRFGTAFIQFGTVAGYVVGTLALGDRRALLFALGWNLWSVVEAYRHDRYS